MFHPVVVMSSKEVYPGSVSGAVKGVDSGLLDIIYSSFILELGKEHGLVTQEHNDDHDEFEVFADTLEFKHKGFH